ncbi:basic salivary proline-rich protein 4-like [Elephas maximus indicus]|uniref:basic salivary proline-rich protein 4-like n=1 Tax=Elephas maximus indicus TaxID=99487 RepID=UPI00211620BE|nr:basic salivary proline-rich protein 4-like [Elephas maximus indicus]
MRRLLQPGVQPRGGETIPSPAPPDHTATPDRGALHPSAVGQRERPRLPPGQPGEYPPRSGEDELGRWDAGGRSERPVQPPASSRATGCASAEIAREVGRGVGVSWERSSRGGGARGTHQLQRAEADERAAPSAAAHGAGGVRAARAMGDRRPSAAPPPPSRVRSSPAGAPRPARTRLGAPAAAARGWRVGARASPLLVRRPGGLSQDPSDVSSDVPRSTSSSETSLNFWQFPVDILLQPFLNDLQHNFAWMRY